MPSWVGLGWNLDVGGVITRTMRGGRDESNRKTQGEHVPRDFFFGYMHNWQLWQGQRDHRFEGNILDIRYRDGLDCNSFSIDPFYGGQDLVTKLDHLPDEFSFNFMGYSGTFFWDASNSRFVVNSEHAIRVDFDFSEDTVRGETINRDLLLPQGRRLYATDGYISHFRLVTPDGMTYVFGSKGSLHGVEVSAPRQNAYRHDVTTSSWFLTQIISPNGFQVNLHYERGPVVANLYPHYERHSFQSPQGGFPPDDRCINRRHSEHFTCNLHSPARTIQGQVIFPVYLREITFSTGRILFARSNSNAKRYCSRTLNSIVRQDNSSRINHFSLGDLSSTAFWQKLDAITVFNDANQPFKRFDFSYIENPDQRLKLRSVQERALGSSGSVIASKPPYEFHYNENLLPDLNLVAQSQWTPVIDRVDHWGFANDNQRDSDGSLDFIRNFHLWRQPSNNPNTFLAEILEKIVWPTGGYTQFDYEPHRYSQKVSLNRHSLDHCLKGDCLAGGVRIQRITSVDMANQQNTGVKEYLYQILRPPQENLVFLPISSGILATQPFYFYEGQENIFPHPSSMFNSNMLLPIGEAIAGSHIGYSVVYEIERALNVNGTPGTIIGRTRSRFTNFDTGDGYMDRGIAGVVVDVSGAVLSPLNNGMFIVGSRAHRRGKLIEKTHYSMNSTGGRHPIRRTQIQHTTMNIASGARTQFNAFYFSPACNFRGYIVDLETQVWQFLEVYLPASKTITYYVNQGAEIDSLTTQIFYTYTPHRLLRSQTTINSEGDNIRTEFFYPPDFTTVLDASHAIRQMVNKNMINRPIEVRTSVNNMIVSGAARTYGLFNGNLLLPDADFILELNAPIPNPFGQSLFPWNPNSNYRKILHYTNYDSRGNLQSFTDRSGVHHSLIWGYRQTRPIAYIQNATWAQIRDVLGDDRITNMANSTNTDVIRIDLATLRNNTPMPNAHIYTYTYQFPFGINSATNPSGITTFYEYDHFGRLITTRDRNLQILEQIIYNYRNPLP
jgi:YD repeat-containing protein